MTTDLTKRIDANGIKALLNSSQSLEPKAVGIQFLVMITLSFLTIITFNTLRSNNQAVYEPKIKYHPNNMHPPRIPNSCCGWIYPVWYTSEDTLTSQIGLDAVSFLRFLRLIRWLFTLTAVCACGVLIPLDFLYTLLLKPTGYDILTAMTIRDVQGNRLYAHIGIEYLVTFVLLGLVYHHWRIIHRLRSQWLRSSEYQRCFHARTLYITDVPRRRQSTTGLYGIFKGMNLPYPITSVHIGTSVGELPKLIENHDKLVEEFEEVLLQSNLRGDRPIITTGGFCGIGGRQQDPIGYYIENLKHTAALVQQYRAQKQMREPENYGFATVASIPLAHAAARELKGMHPKGLTFKLAPNSQDIIWKNMGLSKTQRRFKKISGFLLLYFFSFLSLIPLFPIASLANLDAIAASGYIPFLQRWIQHSPLTFTLVSGLLPPAVAAIFGSFIPILMRWLSKYMGASTHSSLDRIVIARYFTFLVISQLVFFTVIGVIFNSILEIIIAIENEGANVKLVLANLDKLPARLAVTYVDQSSFWLKWFALNGFVLTLDLARLFEVVYTSCRMSASRYTPRQFQQLSKPPIFNYGVQYSNLLFMCLVGLLFAPMAPLVSLAAAILFWLCSWVFKYQLLFKYVTRVETGGRAWNVVINRLLFSCMFMQTVMVITIGFQAQFKSLKFLATLPPILLTTLSKYYIDKWFANEFEYYTPDHTERSRSFVYSEKNDATENKLKQRYENPALYTRIFSPMIHAAMMSVLSRRFKDRSRSIVTCDISDSEKAVSDSSTDAILEGTSITPVNETELEYDPMLYKHDREVNCDFDSVNGEPSTLNLHPHRSTSYVPQDHFHGNYAIHGVLGHQQRLSNIPNTKALCRESSSRTSKSEQGNIRPQGGTGESIHQPRSITGSIRASQHLQRGQKHDGHNLNAKMSREQSNRTEWSHDMAVSGSGRHTQVARNSKLRTPSESRARPRQHLRSVHKQTDTPLPQVPSTS